MAKKTLNPAVAVCAAILSLSMTSCSRETDGAFRILEGGLAWSRKDWASAVSAFVETAESAKSLGNGRLRDYAVYGLATAYLSQDEFDAALERFSAIDADAESDIRSGMWYQSGIIAYRRGEYENAAAFFRKSLECDPSAIDAKVNLELSMRIIAESKSGTSNGSAGIRENPDGSQEAESIFNLIRKKEQDIWKNREDSGPQGKIADY